MIRKYTDLDVQVERNPKGEGYWARASIPGRVEWTTFEEPFSREELEELRDAIVEGVPRNVDAWELGRRLFERVFTGPVRDLLNESLPQSDSKQGLRLRLRPSPEVWHWPWELLHSREEFLALSIKTLVVRQPDVARDFRTRRSPYPLRVLLVISSPRDCEQLDGEQELKEIQSALGWLKRWGIVEVERLVPPTLPALLALSGRKPFHVLHFVGHGRFNSEHGEGELLFEDPERRADYVDGRKLGVVLDGCKSLRLVVLNACEAARSGSEEPFSGVAKSLIQKRIPAVVAMQYPIDDAMAVRFASHFYAALVRGRAVDWAVTQARRAMNAAGKGLDWIVPVLLLSSSDGRLFRWRPSWSFLGALAMVPLLSLGYLRWSSGVVTPAVPTPAFIQPCPSVEGLDMEFVRIPAGRFTMGSGKGDEAPAHEVVISRPFCLGTYEVTQKQWESVMGTNSVESKHRGDDLPVTYVTWEEVQSFLGKVNKQAGRKVVRLPTEAEWEYGAGGSGGVPAGSNCLHDQIDGLASVGSLRPNRWGLHDMLGNAWEWVEDWYGPYPKGLVSDPRGPSLGEGRVKRGGGFDSAARHCRATRRSQEEPSRRANDLGFRVVRELDPDSRSAENPQGTLSAIPGRLSGGS
ncbi:MAG: SUMF1/EgtB/PvdO family nonheme iron enzyme [Thermoanaerobaculia bacterium]